MQQLLPLKKKWVGTGVKRRESKRLVRGEGAYGDDIKVSNLHYIGIVRSPHAHARILNVDTSAAEKMPEEVAVFTAKDLKKDMKPGGHMLPYPAPDAKEWLPGTRLLWRYPLAGAKTHYVGEAVAIVVCKDMYSIEDAIEAVGVEYEVLPAVVDAEQAMKPGSPLLYEELGDNISYTFRYPEEGEDDELKAAFKSADKVVRGRFKQHRHTGTPMETRNVTANYDTHNETLTVWEGTQNPNFLRMQLTKVLGIPEAKIRIIVPNTGGGFGIRCFGYDESFLIPYVAYKIRKPVRWTENRMEHFLATGHAREQIHDYEAAVKKDGTIIGLRDRIIVDGGAVNVYWASWRSTAFNLPGPYKIQNLSVDLYGVFTNKTPYWSYRAFGKLDADVAMERIIDHVARELTLSPIQVRVRNFVKKHEFPYETATGAVLDSGDYDVAVERALKLIDYDKFREEQTELRKGGRYVGFGLVMCFEPTGAGGIVGVRPGYEPVRFSMTPTGDIIIETGSCSQGQAHETTLAQVVADELSVDPDRVVVLENDTMYHPYGFGAYSSRFSINTVPAAVVAARKAKEKIFQIAGFKLGLEPLDLTVEDGVVFSKKNPERRITLSEVARVAYLGADEFPPGIEPGLEVLAYFKGPTIGKKGKRKGTLNIFSTYPYAVHAAIVEVHVDTGKIDIRKYAAFHDCGTVINPKVIETEHMGSIAQGLGGALYEELVYDKDGQLLTTTFMDYHIPTFLEMPNVLFDHTETPSPFTPLGTKGGSETGTVGPPIVIAQAVEDALSQFNIVITETPLTMDRIWAKIKGAGTKPH